MFIVRLHLKIRIVEVTEQSEVACGCYCMFLCILLLVYVLASNFASLSYLHLFKTSILTK